MQEIETVVEVNQVITEPVDATQVSITSEDNGTKTVTRFYPKMRMNSRLAIQLGPPNETQVVNGITLRLYDEFGLPMDPILYASHACNTCYGRGIVGVSRPMTLEEAKDRIAKADMKTLKKIVRYNRIETSSTCSCVQRMYARARNTMFTYASSAEV